MDDVLKEYPNLYGLQIHQAYYSDDKRKVNISICLKEEFWQTNWISVLTGGIHTDWFEGLEKYSTLKGLDISSNQSAAIASIFSENSFPYLERLSLSLNPYAGKQEDKFSHKLIFKSLPALKTLLLYDCENFEILDALPALEELRLIHMGNLNLPAVLKFVSPEKLTYLEVWNSSNVQFIDQDTAQNPLYDFVNLTHLSLQNNRFKTLPISLEHFPKLKILNLSHNKFTTFPDSFLSLPALEKMDVSGTPIVKNRVIKGGSEIVKLLQHCHAQNISIEDRKKLFHILIEHKTNDTALPLEEILRLYTLAHNDNLQRKLIALAENALPQNPLEKAGKVSHIALVGKMPALNWREQQSFFKNHGITLTNQYTPETQIVCIGEKADAQQIQLVLESKAHQQALIICFPTHLKALMHQLETPYLVESDSNVSDNLKNLLQSEDSNNILLALQMIRNGGLPHLFLEYLCFQLARKQHTWWDLKKELLFILEKYATPAQFIVIKKIANAFDVKDNISKLLHATEFEPSKVIEAVFYFFPEENIDRYKDYFLYCLKAEIWQTKDKVFEQVLMHYLGADGKLTISNQNEALKRIPQDLKKNPHILYLAIDENLLQTKVAKDLVKTLPNLTTLEVLYPQRLLYPPAEIQKKHEAYATYFPKLTVVMTAFASTY